MSEQYALVIEGLESLADLDSLPRDIITAARRAVNHAATRGRTEMGREVLQQIKFPADYVSPRNKRLFVSKQAKGGDLEAIITARRRSTSLSRFAQTGGKGGNIRVELKRGAVRQIPGKRDENRGYSAFLIRLKAGNADLDTKHNMGFALRVPPGRRPDAAYAPKPLGGNLWLLYGPSVSQLILPVKNSRAGVAETLTPDIQDRLNDEFWRQMDL